MENEIWKDIPGFEGIYQMSNSDKDKIRSLTRTRGEGNRQRTVYGISLKLNSINNDGYKIVCLSNETTKRTFSVHRLKAILFLPNPDNKPEVNHVNFNKLDNSLSNLQWSTGKENTNHSAKNSDFYKNRRPRGENAGNSLLSEKEVYEIRRLRKQGIGVKTLKGIFDISENTIYKVINRELWKHLPEEE